VKQWHDGGCESPYNNPPHPTHTHTHTPPPTHVTLRFGSGFSWESCFKKICRSDWTYGKSDFHQRGCVIIQKKAVNGGRSLVESARFADSRFFSTFQIEPFRCFSPQTAAADTHMFSCQFSNSRILFSSNYLVSCLDVVA